MQRVSSFKSIVKFGVIFGFAERVDFKVVIFVVVVRGDFDEKFDEFDEEPSNENQYNFKNRRLLL